MHRLAVCRTSGSRLNRRGSQIFRGVFNAVVQCCCVTEWDVKDPVYTYVVGIAACVQENKSIFLSDNLLRVDNDVYVLCSAVKLCNGKQSMRIYDVFVLKSAIMMFFIKTAIHADSDLNRDPTFAYK